MQESHFWDESWNYVQGAEPALHTSQREVFLSDHRFRCVVAGRRWGRTTLALSELRRAFLMPGKRRVYGVLSSCRSMILNDAFRDLLKVIPHDAVEEVNQARLRITGGEGSSLTLLGWDAIPDLRGRSVDFLVLDEVQNIEKEVWSELRSVLASTHGRALFLGTHRKGAALLAELYLIGQRQDLRWKNIWKSWALPSASSPFIARDVMNELVKGSPPLLEPVALDPSLWDELQSPSNG